MILSPKLKALQRYGSVPLLLQTYRLRHCSIVAMLNCTLNHSLALNHQHFSVTLHEGTHSHLVCISLLLCNN